MAETTKSIVFDTGPIISLATNNLLWILEPLEKAFGGDFLMPPGVRKELIDNPLRSKRFKFEAMQALNLVNNGVLKIVDDSSLNSEIEELMDIANKIFRAKGNWMQIVHYGEIGAIAVAMMMGSSAMVIDERTTRMLIEDPDSLRKMMEKKLHTKVEMNKDNLNEFGKRTKGIKMIRSTELAMMAYEKGLLDRFLPNIPQARKELIDGVLWGIKLNGCSISEMEIDRIIKLETKNG
ncbi:MAG: hypothetical protein NT001_03280 [Candidatus Woesearchaeota archaeon]|nr:hypothetical protein [Candidatus Woesearchaeota archaeon]